MRAVSVMAAAVLFGVGLAGCSSDSTPGASDASAASPGNGTTSVTPGAAVSGASVPGSTHVATGTAVKGIEGSETATVKITSCKATKTGVDIEASVTNTTTGPRTFVVAVKVRAGGKDAGGAAVLASNVAPNKTVKATGTSKTPVKGTPTCTVSNVNGIDS